MGNVVMSKDQAGVANDAINKLVSEDVEKAVEFFVTFGGMEHDAAVAHVEELAVAIRVADAKDALKNYFVDMRDAVEIAVMSFMDEHPLHDTVEEIKGEIKYDSSPHPDDPNEIIGLVVTVPKFRLEGEPRMRSVSARKSGGGNGGTKSPSVPCPEGIKNWQAHLAANYPEIVAEKTGSYSAPKELLKLEDEVYMAAKAAAGM